MHTTFLTCLLLGAMARAQDWNARKVHDESFEYIDEPLAKFTDPTQATDNLIAFTESEFLTPEVVDCGEGIYVAIGFALGNSIMVEGDLFVCSCCLAYACSTRFLHRISVIRDQIFASAICLDTVDSMKSLKITN